MEVEQDLSGVVAFTGKYALIRFRRRNDAHVVLAENFIQQGDFKMHIQLPGYDDFQCYDLGIDTILSQIAQKIYTDFHKPSWQTLRRHLFMAQIPKKLFRESSEILLKAIKMTISNRE